MKGGIRVLVTMYGIVNIGKVSRLSWASRSWPFSMIIACDHCSGVVAAIGHIAGCCSNGGFALF